MNHTTVAFRCKQWPPSKSISVSQFLKIIQVMQDVSLCFKGDTYYKQSYKNPLHLYHIILFVSG
jgi:hypothetical protein